MSLFLRYFFGFRVCFVGFVDHTIVTNMPMKRMEGCDGSEISLCPGWCDEMGYGEVNSV